MISLIYLLLAILRFFVSKIDPAQRKLILFYRAGVFVFTVALNFFVQLLAHSIGGYEVVASLAEVLVVIAIGEHMIYSDLEKRQVLPPNAPRLPLAV